MGGHGHDHGHQQTNPNAIPEPDSAMPYKIREINLIKFNPNMFHVSPYDACKTYSILGGSNFLASSIAGGLFGYLYYAQKVKHTPATFYAHILLSFSRIALGAVVGGWIGYMRFGDRQRLHNAWVAERLRRRYPESLDLNQTDLYKMKGMIPQHHFYKWT